MVNVIKEHIHGSRFANEVADVAWDFIKWENRGDVGFNRNCIVFCKTDWLDHIFGILNRKPYKYILITHNSDKSIDAKRYNSKPKNVVLWYAQNVAVDAPLLIPLPIGVERPAGGGSSWDMRFIDRAKRNPRQITNLVYVNHNIKNNVDIRRPIDLSYQDKKWVTIQSKRLPFKDYLDDLRSHQFVISPPGNGIDCHRTWEAMYVGCIPIVMRSPAMKLYDGLPMLKVNNLCTLSKHVLLGYLNNTRVSSYSYDLMRFSYWKDMIKQSARELL